MVTNALPAGSFLGAWLWSTSPSVNFLGAALLGGAGALWFWCFVCRAPAAGQRVLASRTVKR